MFTTMRSVKISKSMNTKSVHFGASSKQFMVIDVSQLPKLQYNLEHPWSTI